MSICDRCFKPGYCCTMMNLSTGVNQLVHWEDKSWKDIEDELSKQGLPFKVKCEKNRWLDEETGKFYLEYYYYCPKLDGDGRCTIYQNRPDTCRNYQPASDELCVHYGGSESGFIE